MQEYFWMWFFGLFCGIILAAGFDGIAVWSRVCDAYYWAKDKVEHRKWLRR